MDVAQWKERSPLTPEFCGSTPILGFFEKYFVLAPKRKKINKNNLEIKGKGFKPSMDRVSSAFVAVP